MYRVRCDCGASLSCVKTIACLAAASIIAIWFAGSTGEIAMPVDSFGQQIVDDPLLLGGGAVGSEAELGLDIGQLRVRLLDAAARDRPEVGRVVRDEGELEGLRGYPHQCGALAAGGAHEQATPSTPRSTAHAFVHSEIRYHE